jgi:hypothetical protein
MRLPLTPDMANGLPAAALGIGLRHLTPTRSEMRSPAEQVVDEEIDQLDAYERGDDPPRGRRSTGFASRGEARDDCGRISWSKSSSSLWERPTHERRITL